MDCNCDHEMRIYSDGKFHIREGKSIERSKTCFRCPCNHPEPRMNDIRVEEMYNL